MDFLRVNIENCKTEMKISQNNPEFRKNRIVCFSQILYTADSWRLSNIAMTRHPHAASILLLGG